MIVQATSVDFQVDTVNWEGIHFLKVCKGMHVRIVVLW